MEYVYHVTNEEHKVSAFCQSTGLTKQFITTMEIDIDEHSMVEIRELINHGVSENVDSFVFSSIYRMPNKTIDEISSIFQEYAKLDYRIRYAIGDFAKDCCVIIVDKFSSATYSAGNKDENNDDTTGSVKRYGGFVDYLSNINRKELIDILADMTGKLFGFAEYIQKNYPDMRGDITNKIPTKGLNVRELPETSKIVEAFNGAAYVVASNVTLIQAYDFLMDADERRK